MHLTILFELLVVRLIDMKMEKYKKESQRESSAGRRDENMIVRDMMALSADSLMHCFCIKCNFINFPLFALGNI